MGGTSRAGGRTLRFAGLLVLTGSVALDCASKPRAYFAADRTRAAALETGEPIETRNYLPVAAVGADPLVGRLRVATEACMFEDEPLEGLSVPTLRVRVYVSNHGPVPFEMRTADFVAI